MQHIQQPALEESLCSKCFLMQMDREKRSLGNTSAHLMTLDEVPKFVLEPVSGAKSGTVSDEEGLDDIMDPRQRRRMLRKSLAQSEVRRPWSVVLHGGQGQTARYVFCLFLCDCFLQG